ncbi:unnamed protein product, partial [Adineta steineri]
MKSNKVNVYNSVHPVRANPMQPSTLSGYYDTRKLTRILFSIIVIILLLAVFAIVFLTKKTNDENASIIEELNLETTSKEQLIPSVIINTNTKWKQNAITVVGGNGWGSKSNQLNYPSGIYIDDDDHNIYIADTWNHRIVRWEFGGNNGEIVAGGNGQGSAIHQLNHPKDVILDKDKKNIVICDHGNFRVIQWSLQNSHDQQILIYPILCWGLAIDNNGDLYISDWRKHQVKRWKQGDKEGTVVAGGNEKGNRFNQLDQPTSIFVDEYHSVYIADYMNNRVMKWIKNATEGILVAPGQDADKNPNSLIHPIGMIVDHIGNIYMSDVRNSQITRWSPGTIEGVPVVGEKKDESKPMEISYLYDLS